MQPLHARYQPMFPQPAFTGRKALLAGDIAYYFGTFNPIHNGHIALAEAAARQFGFRKVVFVPAFVAPHKDPSQVVSFADRYEMIRRAIKDKPLLDVIDIERKLPTPSYTAQTVQHIKKTLDPRPRIPFICGLDVIRDLPQWHNPRFLIDTLRFIVYPRGGGYIPKGVKIDGRWQRLKARTIEPRYRYLSSTLVRDKVSRGESIAGLVPPAVDAFIRRKGFYRKSQETPS